MKLSQVIADKRVTDVLPEPVIYSTTPEPPPAVPCATMSSKAALKAIRAALDSKDYEDAADKAKNLVQREPDNYHA